MRVTTRHYECPPSVFPELEPPSHEHGHTQGGYFIHEHQHDGPHHHDGQHAWSVPSGESDGERGTTPDLMSALEDSLAPTKAALDQSRGEPVASGEMQEEKR